MKNKQTYNNLDDIEKQIESKLSKETTKPTLELKKTIKDLVKESEINPFERIEIPPTVIRVDGIPFGSLGNFSCLTGKSKSRKTFFLSMLIAAALDDCGKFQRIQSDISETTIIHFDTEQAKHHTQTVAKRIHSMLGKTKTIENYKTFCLRPYDPKTRIEIIEEVIYNTTNAKLILIDGVADLIIGYNNEEEAAKIMNKFLKWTFDLNIHIITVVHQNKGDNNAKGHLGSLIYQKAETVMSVEKDGNISKVETSHSRDIEIPPISFSIDENGLPYFVDYIPSITTNGKPKTDPFNIEIDTHKNTLIDVFKNDPTLTRQQFLDNLKFTLGSYDLANGDSKCKEFLNHYKQLKLVTQDGTNKPYRLNF